MAEREAQRRRGERHAVAAAGGLQPSRTLADRLGRRGVIVLRVGHRTGDEDAAVERPADDDADAALDTEREEFLGGFLLEKRVAAGKQEAVDRDAQREVAADLPFVDAEADGADRARGLEIGESAIGSVQGFGEAPRLLVAMRPPVDVVDEDDVDAVELQPLEAFFQRAQRAVAAVVVDDLAIRRVDEAVAIETGAAMNTVMK